PPVFSTLPIHNALPIYPDTVLVANCDDVRITSIAFDAPSVVWVAAGLGAEGVVRACPRCGGLITVDPAPEAALTAPADGPTRLGDRKSTRLNPSHVSIS